MASYNRVILMGNLCRDVELKYIASGLAVTEISVAVNDKRKTASGEWVEEVTFVDCTLFGRTAEIAGEYLSKGSPIFLEGRLKLDTWEKDGQKRSKMRVVCDKMQLIGGRGAEGSTKPKSQSSGASNNRYPEANMQMDAAHEHHEAFEEESPLPF